jgi:hypothetical protein
MPQDARPTFTGTSAAAGATLDKALESALSAAADFHRVNLFWWKLVKVGGTYGGFVGRTIEVTIETSEGGTGAPAGTDSAVQHVHAVKSVAASWLDRTRLQIDATGLAASTGWTEPRLNPRVYVRPPDDGIWEFDFVATPPDGPSLPSLSEVTARHVWTVPYGSSPAPRGFRVYAAQGSVEKLLSDTTAPD